MVMHLANMKSRKKSTGKITCKEDKAMYEVYIYSAGGVRKHFVDCETEQAAIEFCEDYGYEWADEFGFVWGMNYREV